MGLDWSEKHQDMEINDAEERRLERARLPEGMDSGSRFHAVAADYAEGGSGLAATCAWAIEGIGRPLTVDELAHHAATPRGPSPGISSRIRHDSDALDHCAAVLEARAVTGVDGRSAHLAGGRDRPGGFSEPSTFGVTPT